MKEHAKALGLTGAEVEKRLDEKEYARYKTNAERLDAERAAAEAAAKPEGEGEGEGEGQTLGEKLKDGLGGLRNVR